MDISEKISDKISEKISEKVAEKVSEKEVTASGNDKYIICFDHVSYSYYREGADDLQLSRNEVQQERADLQPGPSPALDDITLGIRRGSFTAVLGRNGSGKSTLAKHMNGLVLPDQGKVLVNGYDTGSREHIRDVRETVGMVFQNPDNQLVAAIVEDDVAFGPENLAVEPDEIRRIVTESLKAVDMLDNRYRAPHMLSGGQKQRIAIAGAIAMRPECIVFDEPTSMLDPRGREDVLRIIEELHKEGITVVLVTHYMEEAAEADRILVMDKGKVILDGTPEEVFAERDIVEKAGLELPAAADLADRLRRLGVDVPADALTEERLVSYLI